MKMRFCMITTFYPPWGFGGDAVFVQHLTHALADRGHEVHVIHCRDSFRALGGRAGDAVPSEHPNVIVHGLESPVGWLSPLATHQTGRPVFKTRKIRRLLDQGFDVIHYHNVSLIGGPEILRLGSAVKLYTLHEYWLVCPTHLLFRFEREPCTRPTCLSCTLAHHRPPQLWRHGGTLARSVGHVDAFLSPSRFGIDIHRRLGLQAPLVHLPNFVPAASINPPAAAHTDAEPYFLYVGRLETAKGAHTLLPLFRRWGRATLLVAGQGRDGPRLRRLAEGCDRIRFLGAVSAEHLGALYRDAVAVIVPSLTFELFPLVVLEAFRAGTPVVARNLGSLPEIIAESGGGVSYDDDQDLEAALTRLLSDRSWRDQLGRRAAQAQARLWSSEAHVDRYLGVVREVAARRRATLEATTGGTACSPA
jgi:glycosyltransferase involved in cell wall biosynthesis